MNFPILLIKSAIILPIDLIISAIVLKTNLTPSKMGEHMFTTTFLIMVNKSQARFAMKHIKSHKGVNTHLMALHIGLNKYLHMKLYIERTISLSTSNIYSINFQIVSNTDLKKSNMALNILCTNLQMSVRQSQMGCTNIAQRKLQHSDTNAHSCLSRSQKLVHTYISRLYIHMKANFMGVYRYL